MGTASDKILSELANFMKDECGLLTKRMYPFVEDTYSEILFVDECHCLDIHIYDPDTEASHRFSQVGCVMQMVFKPDHIYVNYMGDVDTKQWRHDDLEIYYADPELRTKLLNEVQKFLDKYSTALSILRDVL